MTPPTILCLVLSYFIGGIPIGYLVGRAQGLDIRTVGSGNIGASNVLRTLGVKAGVGVLLLDVAKAWLPTWGAAHLFPELDKHWELAAVGLAAVVGHSFSPYLRLRGGRGVSTGLGMVLALNPLAGLGTFAVWVVVVAATRYISLGSIIAGAASPLLLIFLGAPPAYWLPVFLAMALIVWRHTPNIQRLLAGTERKIGQRVKGDSPEGTVADG